MFFLWRPQVDIPLSRDNVAELDFNSTMDNATILDSNSTLDISSNDTASNASELLDNSTNIDTEDDVADGDESQSEDAYDPIKHYDEQAHANVKWFFDLVLKGTLGFLFN